MQACHPKAEPRLARGLLLVLMAFPSAAQATRVVVTPVEAKDVDYGIVRDVNRVLVTALKELPKLTVMESRALSQELGVNLSEQVHDCNKEVLCLVQIGEAVGADRLLLSELMPAKPSGTVLKFFVVDVKKAALSDTLRWTIPFKDGAVDDSVPAAMRQLFAPPDARVILEITPKDAELRLYGEVAKAQFWTEVPFWSGVYYAQLSRKGHDPREVRFSIPPGGPTRIVIELEQDPLYVDPTHKTRPSAPGAKDKARFEVVTAENEPGPTPPPGPPRPSAFSNWIAWSVAGVGVAAGVTGAMVMRSAQGSYNELSGQARFGVKTTPVDVASSSRDGARSRYSLGGGLAAGGAGLAGAALLWMVVDGLIHSDEAEVRAAIGPTISGSGGGMACSVAF